MTNAFAREKTMNFRRAKERKCGVNALAAFGVRPMREDDPQLIAELGGTCCKYSTPTSRWANRVRIGWGD